MKLKEQRLNESSKPKRGGISMATKANPLSYLNFWEEASALEIGLFIECASEDDKRLLVNALYECRKQSGGFDDLMIFQPNPSNVLYIAKKTTELPE